MLVLQSTSLFFSYVFELCVVGNISRCMVLSVAARRVVASASAVANRSHENEDVAVVYWHTRFVKSPLWTWSCSLKIGLSSILSKWISVDTTFERVEKISKILFVACAFAEINSRQNDDNGSNDNILFTMADGKCLNDFFVLFLIPQETSNGLAHVLSLPVFLRFIKILGICLFSKQI